MLITDLKTGGVPLHVYRLATALDPAGFDVCVGSLAPPGEVSTMLDRAGVRTFACDAGGPWDARAMWRLARWIRSERPDVLHAFLFHANTAACLVGPPSGVSTNRIITEIQTVEIERPWHLALGGATCRLCRCIVGNSPAVIEHLQRNAHIPASRLHLIPGGVDVRRFAEATPIERRTIGVPQDAKLLLWVGRLDPVKGLDDLVDAVAMLNDPGVVLVLTGEGSYEPTVRRRIEKAGLLNRVRLIGRRDDAPNLLAAADAFVFPSRTEGMPNALLEAMAAARPIVASDIPGCRNLITHNETGLLTPPCRPAELADGIRRLIRDTDLAGRLARAARQRVEAHYSFHATVARYAALYEAVVELHSTSPRWH
jgi:glycosyltransferase involved in cell wall biosynthesis